MKSSKLTSTIIILIILSASSTFAFDGEPKGFVLGGGVFYMPSYNWHEVVDDTKGGTDGFGMKLSFGINWNNRDMIAVEMIPMGKFNENSEKPNSHGYFGLNWYHDLNPQKKSFFTSAGAGLSFGGIDNQGFVGAGIMLGGGYEIAKHIDVELNYFYLNNGSLFIDKDYRFHIIHLALTVSAF